MKIKVSELSGIALDWAIAQIEGKEIITIYPNMLRIIGSFNYSPSSDWSQGGPIIERELIQVSPEFHNEDCSINPKYGGNGWHWVAYVLGPNNVDNSYGQEGASYLTAAMRCYVASKLGDEVEIPDELVED